MLNLKSAVLATVTLLGHATRAQTETRACNNSPLLCDRAYSNVTHLGAHDSMFVRNQSNRYSLSGNQFFTSPVQLDAGVRLLTGQVHTFGNEINLCHTICQLYSAGTLSGWLASIKEWLDYNPNEVVTILLVNSNNLPSSTYETIFESVNITQYIYAPPDVTQAFTEWPTLGEMIDMGKRLVVYFQPLDTDSSLLLNQYTFTFENNYDVTSPSGFSCDASRPDTVTNNTALALSQNLLPLMNHFLDRIIGNNIEIPAVENVTSTNSPSETEVGSLGYAADQCTEAYGKPPTYIIVDFVNVGPAIDTVDRLNGIEGNIVGRRSLPNQIYTLSGTPATATLPLYDSTATSLATTTGSSMSSSLASSLGATATSMSGSSSSSLGSPASSVGSSTGSSATSLATATGTAPASGSAIASTGISSGVYTNSTGEAPLTMSESSSPTQISQGTTSVSKSVITGGVPTSSLTPATGAAAGGKGGFGTHLFGWTTGLVVAVGLPILMLRGGM